MIKNSILLKGFILSLFAALSFLFSANSAEAVVCNRETYNGVCGFQNAKAFCNLNYNNQTFTCQNPSTSGVSETWVCGDSHCPTDPVFSGCTDSAQCPAPAGGGSGGGKTACKPPSTGNIAPPPGGLLGGLRQTVTSVMSAVTNLRSLRSSQPFTSLTSLFQSPTVVSGRTTVTSPDQGISSFFGTVENFTDFSSVFSKAVDTLPSNAVNLTITNGSTQFQYQPGGNSSVKPFGPLPGTFKEKPCDGTQ